MPERVEINRYNPLGIGCCVAVVLPTLIFIVWAIERLTEIIVY